jgi:mono/diheme cytochrome c family protein
MNKSQFKTLAVIIVPVVTILILAACNSPRTSSPSLADIAAGKQLFETNCATCHGTDGAGGNDIEGATAADIRFNALNDLYKGNWSLARNAILDGKDEEGGDMDAIMPRWRGRLSNKEVGEIIAYLQTLR